MWKYAEADAYDDISLHDCRADMIEYSGSEVVFDFPDGFWILPGSKYIQHDRPLKTGPAQLRVHLAVAEEPFDTIDVYKTTRVFGKPIVCRRLRPEYADFLKMFKTGKYELEFLTEYHSSISSLYQCWIWKKRNRMVAECQFDMIIKSIEYCWNEIRYDREM